MMSEVLQILRPVYTTKRFVSVSGGAGFKLFSRVHTGIIMNQST